MFRTKNLISSALVTGAVLFAVTTPFSRNQVNGQSEQDTKRAIVRAWKDRQDRTQTALFEWDQTNRMRLSTRLPFVRNHIRKEFPDVGEFVKVEQPSSIRLNKDKFDYRFDTIDSAKYCMPTGLRYSYDGRISQTFSGISSPDSVGSGIVQGDAHAFGTMMLYATPLLVHYRPLHPTMSHIDVDKYRVKTDKVPAGSHLCILLEEMESKPVRARFWLDPDNEFVLRRYEETVEGQAVQRVDVSYSLDNRYGLVPTEWTTTTLITGTDNLNSAAQCKVRHYKINEAIPLSDFQIEYPTGTLVTDRMTGSTYRAGETQSAGKWWFLSAAIFLVAIAILRVLFRRRVSFRKK